jgi:hypothetical protein
MIWATNQTMRDPLMVAYWERMLNGLLYELYFPEELHGTGLLLFDLAAQSALPEVNKLPEAKRLKTLRAKFEEHNGSDNPLRPAPEKLSTQETISYYRRRGVNSTKLSHGQNRSNRRRTRQHDRTRQTPSAGDAAALRMEGITRA